MNVLKEYILPCLYAFFCCAGFCIVYNMRGKKLFYAPLGGVIGWLVYLLTNSLQNEMLQFFLAAVAFSIYAEIMARVQRAPVTCYLLPALLPLVPGGGIYYTMECSINGDIQGFMETGLHTIGLAGALALGVVVVSSVTRLYGAVHDSRNAEDA